MMLHNVNNNQVYRLNSGSSPLCSKPRRKFVQTSYALKSQFIGLIFVAYVKNKLNQSHTASSESHNIYKHTYVMRAVHKAHFKLNRAFVHSRSFKVIPC